MYFEGRDGYYPTLDALVASTLSRPRKVITPHSLGADAKTLGWEVLRYEEPRFIGESENTIEPQVEKSFLIEGRVQGTGFRTFAEQAASRHEVAAKVANLPDGTIHLVAIGLESRVERLRKDLEKGPPSNGVERLQETTVRYDYFPSSLIQQKAGISRVEMRAVLLLVFGPDPLEMLARRIVGLPDIVNQ
jgi:acylphosphatase